MYYWWWWSCCDYFSLSSSYRMEIIKQGEYNLFDECIVNMVLMKQKTMWSLLVTHRRQPATQIIINNHSSSHITLTKVWVSSFLTFTLTKGLLSVCVTTCTTTLHEHLPHPKQRGWSCAVVQRRPNQESQKNKKKIFNVVAICTYEMWRFWGAVVEKSVRVALFSVVSGGGWVYFSRGCA